MKNKITQKIFAVLFVVVVVFASAFFFVSPVGSYTNADANYWNEKYTSVTLQKDEDNYYIINNANDLCTLMYKKNTLVSGSMARLYSDINLDANFWVPVYWPKDAILDGNFKTISNVKIDGLKYEYSGFFSEINQNSNIKNLNFNGVTITNPNSYAGCVAAYSYFANVNNVTITNGKITYEKLSDTSSYLELGGVVGTSINSKFTNCYVSCEIAPNSTAYPSNVYVGGIVAESYSDEIYTCCYTSQFFTSTSYNANLTAIGTNSSYCGGIAALVDYNLSTSPSPKIYKCYASGLKFTAGSSTTCEQGGSYAGGIVGELLDGSIENCYNTTPIETDAKYYRESEEFTFSLTGQDSSGYVSIGDTSKADYYAKVNGKAEKEQESKFAYSGGICGATHKNTTISYCYNTAPVSLNGYSVYNYYYPIKIVKNKDSTHKSVTLGCSSNGYYYSGGIAGSNKGAINNCYNNGKTLSPSYKQESNDYKFVNGFSRDEPYDTSYCYRVRNRLLYPNEVYCYKFGGSMTPNRIGYYVGVKITIQIGMGKTELENFYDGYNMTSYDSFVSYGSAKTLYTGTIKYFEKEFYTSTNTTVADIATANSDVFVIDANLNDGNPVIRDFYWQHSYDDPTA